MSASIERRFVPAIANLRARLGTLGLWVLLAAALLAAGLWNLDGRPMWWDEGWTLTVARNWAELGHYGRLREGEPLRDGLEAAFTVTAPVGVMMKLFGVGVWQGRLFGVLCLVGAVLLLAALAHRLYGPRAAWATVGASLLMIPDQQLNPLIQGRDVLAELPMLFYLLAGYLCLWGALNGRRLLLLPAALLLGLAWITKGQTMPFLVLSLAVPLAVALFARRRRIAADFGLTLAGAWATALTLAWAGRALLIDQSLPADPIEGLTSTVALVLDPERRFTSLLLILLLAIGLIPALLTALWMLWRERAALYAPDRAAVWFTRLTLLAFCGSWLAWYLLLSIGWGRYAAPAVFVGSIFVAALLQQLTDNFTLRSLRSPEGAKGRLRIKPGFLLAQLLVVWSLVLTAITVLPVYLREDRSAQRTAAYLEALPPGELIETYESELLFLLDRPYTFPPDQTHVQMVRRSMLDESVSLGYDPLDSSARYLVDGAFAQAFSLYDDVIAAGHFRLIHEDGRYRVYERVTGDAR